MARKKLTEEQEAQIQLLIASNNMFNNTIAETQSKNGSKSAIRQLKNAQEDVLAQIEQIDEDMAKSLRNGGDGKKTTDEPSLFDLMDDMSRRGEPERVKENAPREEDRHKTINEELKPWEREDAVSTVTEAAISPATEEALFNNIDPTAQYDIISLPSNGECYPNKLSKLPVGYLTAYDENFITSPNLYQDGLVIDFLLKNKVLSKDINVDDLVTGDVDAITLYLRASSYGNEFPIFVTDPKTGEQIETVVDLSKLKYKEFKLKGDENGYFDFTLPKTQHKIKFRYLTRKQQKQLTLAAQLENAGSKARLLENSVRAINGALHNDKILNNVEREDMKRAVEVMNSWSEKLKEENGLGYNRIITNNFQMQVVSVDGNDDRKFVIDFINNMPAKDSLALRKYINENAPGVDFSFEVERPKSLGGGSFKTFLNWDASVFLNIT